MTRQDNDSLLPFVIEALRDMPCRDLSDVAGPWMYLRSKGFTHRQLEEHIDAAIAWLNAERAIATTPRAERVSP